MANELTRSEQIAKRNDFQRGALNGMSITKGVVNKPNLNMILRKVAGYTDFNEDNDPYGEHDFGSFMLDGEKYFWKIDYYDQNLQYGLDPLDADCKRVLTIMLAEEY